MFKGVAREERVRDPKDILLYFQLQQMIGCLKLLEWNHIAPSQTYRDLKIAIIIRYICLFGSIHSTSGCRWVRHCFIQLVALNFGTGRLHACVLLCSYSLQPDSLADLATNSVCVVAWGDVCIRSSVFFVFQCVAIGAVSTRCVVVPYGGLPVQFNIVQPRVSYTVWCVAFRCLVWRAVVQPRSVWCVSVLYIVACVCALLFWFHVLCMYVCMEPLGIRIKF